VKKRSLLFVLLLLPIAAFRVAMGCGAQGEGQLCNKANNDNDCNAPLTCQQVPGQAYVCCPPAGGSTMPACMGLNLMDGGHTTVGAGGSGGSGGAGGSGGVPATGGMHGTGGMPGTGGMHGTGGMMGTGGMSMKDAGSDVEEAGISDAGDGG
jgi:hypothetical protein